MCWLPANRAKLKGRRACVELSLEYICVPGKSSSCPFLSLQSYMHLYRFTSIHYDYIPEHFIGCYNACNHMQTSIIITDMLHWLLHLNLHRFEDNNVATVGKQHHSAKGINHPM